MTPTLGLHLGTGEVDNQNLYKIDAAISALQTGATDPALITQLQADVATLQTQVATLQGDVTSLKAQVTDLEARVTALEAAAP
jgi:capsule polysaccharide export protein KpsE/RkpR